MMESMDHQKTVSHLECWHPEGGGGGGGAGVGLDREGGLDLVSRIKEFSLYSGGSGELLNGFEEDSNNQIPL